MIEFYIINTCDLRYSYRTASSIICKEEKVGEDFYYYFLYCKRYLKKHISKNFAILAFKTNKAAAVYPYSIKTKRVPIKELIDDIYDNTFFSYSNQETEETDLTLLHHSIRKLNT